MITQKELDEYNEECELNKLKWGPGPWRDEPNRAEFEAHGFRCLVLRQRKSGHFCGYVGVTKEHPYFGMEETKAYDLDLDVHGGITYARKSGYVVCHIAKENEDPDLFWLGFDCSHAWDFRPGNQMPFGWMEDDQVYRDYSYVVDETMRLAKQLSEVLIWER